jgi:hypothetical protein
MDIKTLNNLHKPTMAREEDLSQDDSISACEDSIRDYNDPVAHNDNEHNVVNEPVVSMSSDD